MRITIAASTNSRVKIAPIFESKRICHGKLQIFAPVTVFFAKTEAELQQVDAVGNPLKGFQLTQGINELWFISGQLFATCNQNIDIEFDWWPLPWVAP